MYSAVCGTEFAMDDVVEYGLEVVEEYGIRGAFEDKSEAPVGVNTTAGCYTGCGDNGVSEEKCYGEELEVISEYVCDCSRACIPCRVALCRTSS